jgi:thioredoxin 1
MGANPGISAAAAITWRAIVAQAGCARRIGATFLPVFLTEPTVSQSAVTHISDDQFDAEVLKSSEPVLVDFWAEWCGPCKMIAPILDDIATAYAGRLKVAKIDIDHNPKIQRNYNVRGIPTLMLFKDGKVQATQIGAIGKRQLEQLIDKTIPNPDSMQAGMTNKP